MNTNKTVIAVAAIVATIVGASGIAEAVIGTPVNDVFYAPAPSSVNANGEQTSCVALVKASASIGTSLPTVPESSVAPVNATGVSGVDIGEQGEPDAQSITVVQPTSTSIQ